MSAVDRICIGDEPDDCPGSRLNRWDTFTRLGLRTGLFVPKYETSTSVCEGDRLRKDRMMSLRSERRGDHATSDFDGPGCFVSGQYSRRSAGRCVTVSHAHDFVL